MLRLHEVIWKRHFVEKFEHKHGVGTDEVEEVLFSHPYIERVERGHVKGEDLYMALGRTKAERYLIVFFILKLRHGALPVSARSMTDIERKYYEKQK